MEKVDLIEDFVAATSHIPAPERFRRWAALGAVSAVLNRNVWTSIVEGLPLFPNLYILFVAKPAVGKSLAIQAARAVLETQPEVNLGPDSITHEAFVQRLGQAAATVNEATGEITAKAALALFLTEWGTFMREPENDDLAMLAAMYDNTTYEAETIGRGKDHAENPYIVIVGACTPNWFAEGFRPNDYEQGLPTRFLFIYSDAVKVRKPFSFGPAKAAGAFAEIAGRFQEPFDKLGRVEGYVGLAQDAAAWFNDQWLAGVPPEPKEPLLSGYCGRRHLHVAKLAILFMLARDPASRIIGLSDAQRAWEVLREAEPDMPKALVAAGGNVYQSRMETIALFVEREYIRTNKPVPEWEIRQRLSQTIAPNLLQTTLEQMLAMQRLRVREGTVYPSRLFIPGAKVK